MFSSIKRLFASDTTRSEDGPSLREDQSGAIMVMGVFMAVFLVGMLYYLVGLSDSIVYRERMQDASDAGAFAAAVTNARGMNLIVLLNIIMAGVMAIVLTLKIIEIVIIAAMAIAAVVGFFCGGCTAPAVTFLGNMQRVVNRANEVIEPIAKGIINAAHVAQKAIRLGWPVLSQLRSVEMMSSGPFASGGVHGPSNAGLSFPVYGALPTEDHVFRETCDRGARYAVRLVAAPFRAIPVIGGKVADFIEGAVGGLYDAYSAYYCGGGPAPSPSLSEDVPRPRDPNFEACQQGCRGSSESHPSCAPCRGSGVGDTDCNNAINSLCHDATQETNISGPTYCPPGSARDARENCAASAEVTFQSCDDPDRVPITVEREGGGTYTRSDSQSLCRTRVRQATADCQVSGARGFQYAMQNGYVVYWKNELPDGTCEIMNTYLRPEDISDEQLDYEVFGNDRDADRRESEINYCTRPGLRGAQGWGMVGPDLAHPWLASCAYSMPEDYTEYPPNAAASPGVLRMRDPSTPEYQSYCNSLPENRTQAIDSIPNGTPGGAEGGGTSYYRIRYTSEVFGCVREEDIPIDVAIGERPAEGEWKPPQRICEFSRGGTGAMLLRTSCPDDGDPIHQGESDFQMRSVALAEAFYTEGERGVAIATWHYGSQQVGEWSNPSGFDISRKHPVVQAMGVISRVSVAQAEFFWDQDEGWDEGLGRGEIEWLWDMSWKARLRRVALDDNARSGASAAGADGGVMDFLNHAFAH